MRFLSEAERLTEKTDVGRVLFAVWTPVREFRAPDLPSHFNFSGNCSARLSMQSAICCDCGIEMQASLTVRSLK